MNNKKALTLSIVIPVYNEEIHLEACLNAIAHQTVMPDEVIVVDNNSTDRSMEIAQSYKFVKIVKEKKQGIFYARNAGFDAVTSDIIGRIDSDTILPKNWVARIKDFYASADQLESAYTGGCYFYNIRLPNFWGWTQGQVAFRVNRVLLGHYITYGSNMAITKSSWKAIRKHLCQRTDIHEDLDLAIHLHRQGYQITYNENLRVGVKMRRVRTGRDRLWENLMLWPNTLKVHNKKTWVFGWIGAAIIYSAWPIAFIQEWIAVRLGREPLKE